MCDRASERQPSPTMLLTHIIQVEGAREMTLDTRANALDPPSVLPANLPAAAGKPSVESKALVGRQSKGL